MKIPYLNIRMIAMLRQASRPALKTFIGTALIKFATGVIGIWGTINIYFLSYLRNQGATITSLTNSLIMLCAIIPSALFVMLANQCSRRFGYKNIVRVCAVLFMTVPLIINAHLNFFTLGLCFLFLPVSCFALSSIPVLNCLWSQFPQSLNKVSGSAVLFFALGMIVWNMLFLGMVNPDNVVAEIDENGQAYFGEEIGNRVFAATNAMFLSSGACFVIGSLLISKRSENEEPEPEKQGENRPKLQEQAQPQLQDDAVRSEVVINSNGQNANLNTLFKLKHALKDRRFVILWLISLLTPMYLIYLVLYMKLVFMPIINDDHYLAFCSVVLTASAIIGAPLWGYLGDKLGFKKTLLLVVSVDLCCKILGILCQQKWNLILMYFCLGFNDKGILTIIGPGLIQIFGLEMATELIPYKGISLFIAYVAVPITQLALPNFDYRVFLIIFILCSIGAVALAYYFFTKVDYIKFGTKSDEKLVDLEKGEKDKSLAQEKIDEKKAVQ